MRLSIKKTKHKGWGVFAEEDIPFGTFIGIYSGELLTDVVADVRGKVYDAFGRTYLFDIDCTHLRKPPKHVPDLVKAMRGVSRNVPSEDWDVPYCVDAFHAGNHTRFLNHSCDPNIDLNPVYTYEADIEKPLLCAFTCKDVDKGDELCFSYHGDDVPAKPKGRKGRRRKSEWQAKGREKGKAEEKTGPRSRVLAGCRCGAAICTGYIFKPPNPEGGNEEPEWEPSDKD